MIKYYLVGGAVRDTIMGITPKDYDFVVTGASVENFSEWQQVGKDFPVFLEPTHGWEVALARTERKVGVGYRGFTCDTEKVTLEEDLLRRDLTINSIAIEVDFVTSVSIGEPVTIGAWIDPCGGVMDIKNKRLSPTSESFKEDPLRVLRAARFMARFPEFTADSEDKLFSYCNSLEWELRNTLTPERVWAETEKALGEATPSNYFGWLLLFGVFDEVSWMSLTDQRKDHHPEGDVWKHTKLVMDYARKQYDDTEVTFAALTHDFGKPICWEKYGNAHGHEEEGLPFIKDFCDKWRVPNSYRELALLVCKHHTKIHGVLGRGDQSMTRPKSIMKLFEATNALGKPERFEKILKCCVADSRGRGGTPEEIAMFESKPYPQMEYLLECLGAVKSYSTKELTSKLLANGKDGVIIGLEVRSARIKQIRRVYNEWGLL